MNLATRAVATTAATLLLATAVATGVAGTTGATPAHADPPMKCGGQNVDGEYWYRNCNYNAVRLNVAKSFAGDWQVCASGKEMVYIDNLFGSIQSVTVDYVYQGPNYFHTCPADD